MTTSEQIRNWNFFCTNTPPTWASAFNPLPLYQQVHLANKFMEIYDHYGASQAMQRFFFELSGDNQILLLDWVEANYQCGFTYNNAHHIDLTDWELTSLLHSVNDELNNQEIIDNPGAGNPDKEKLFNLKAKIEKALIR